MTATDYILLSLCCTPGSSTFAKLLSKFGSPEEIPLDDPEAIAGAIGRSCRDYAAFVHPDRQRAEEIFAFCRDHRVGISRYSDPDFPPSLCRIPSPPVLLYYRGTLPDFSAGFSCAVVGSRRMSMYGKKNTYAVSYDLACAGATVVSGMALGTDGVAHCAALAAGGVTVAVLGCGIDVCYPKEHLSLARNIVRSGCVLTEYPPATPPASFHFPVRNRLISGLSDVCIVTEGTEKSGALYSARYAKEQGKTVYALPGNVDSPTAALPGLLLQNGAKPFMRADDIIREIAKSSPGKLNPYRMEQKRSVEADEAVERFGAYGATVRRAPASDDPQMPVKPPTPRKKKNENNGTQERHTLPVAEEKTSAPVSAVEKEFGADAAKIYGAIPSTGDVCIEELLDAGVSIGAAMPILLKLEIRSYIELLPGDRVRRR